MILTPPTVRLSSQTDKPQIGLLQSGFLRSNFCSGGFKLHKEIVLTAKGTTSITCSSGPYKLVRDRSLDKNVVKINRIRFVQKLKTLLLSKPKHYMPLKILYKCRSYLSLTKPRSILAMIHRYPTIFELFRTPIPPTPFNATKPLSQLCVRLTPAATALAIQESEYKLAMSNSLAEKLQKLLMLSSHQRLLLSKLVHLAPDLGFPVNFRSRLCNDHPDKFKIVDTSYGRALQLVSWDSSLANAFPLREVDKYNSRGLIVDRPPKFRLLRLRKGLNVKRHHQEFLLKFKELPMVCPYKTKIDDFPKESLEAEKRACAVVREVMGMTVEKRTLVDHLTHFRKEFGLPNRLRAMLVRHPELFYVSLKGERDSVFLVEGYDDKGALLERDKILIIRDKLMELVRDGKRMRREHRKAFQYGNAKICGDATGLHHSDEIVDENYSDWDDGLDDLFGPEDFSSGDEKDNGEDGDNNDEDESDGIEMHGIGEYWTSEAASFRENEYNGGSIPW